MHIKNVIKNTLETYIFIDFKITYVFPRFSVYNVCFSLKYIYFKFKT